ncbi:MAG: antibiotic ABC transporter ATP-binding protein [Flavobacteriaceae bacterium]|nr:antibiotic ABC transporter ATP-binding protein [Flavobacteriaceae bacterium]
MSSKVTGSILDVSLFKRLMRYVRPYRFTFIFVLTAAILLSVFSTLNPYLLKITVDDYITLKDYDGMLIFIGIMTGVLFLEVFFQFSFIYYANWLGQRVVYDLRRELFRRMIGFRMTFFDKSAVGRLVTRAVNDIETISSIFSQGLFMIIADLLKMLIVVGVMLSVSWKLSLIVFAVLPLILFATRKFQKAMKFAFDEVRTQVANLNTFVQERISGMLIVQLFVREHQEYQSFQEINEKHKKAWLKTVWYNSIFFPIAELSTSITIGLLVWYGGLSVIAQENGITLGSIFLFIQLTQMLFRPLRQIADKFNTLQMGMVAVQRVFALMDTDSHIPDDGFLETKDMKGKISFQNVVFSYKEGETVINDISFNVNDGETIAIVGATGAGKSTIINLLSRFYDINKGSIELDDKNIKSYKLSSLRNAIAVVLQDVFLFADTIQNNISMWDSSISEEQVMEAATHIGIDKFISKLPGKLQYDVKERGAMLSGGQRQLIAFLRAYVSNPSILVLDEATSSVDGETEELIQIATDRLTEGKTAIIIAHRLATVQKADRIIVMDKGKIVEIGSHEKLLQIDGGFYQNLHNVQLIQKQESI